MSAFTKNQSSFEFRELYVATNEFRRKCRFLKTRPKATVQVTVLFMLERFDESQRQAGGLLIHPDLFAQTDFRLFC
jgi:hypothetical protein